ncbi:hypothetical protein AB0D49_21450 [Streptomyces sp. NPDC048290]|uniref:hypothetical protein n=1 Tax=Streptomyces sp. NPDC048290 TaxID=3155811 RepID=UPI0034120616
MLSEDREDYERVLDEALRSAPHRPELASLGQRLDPDQLRAMALNATTLITAAAATEYQHYVLVRDHQRHPALSTSSRGRDSDSEGSDSGPRSVRAAVGVGAVTDTGGAGVMAVVMVLAPLLAGTVAAISLLTGYLLRLIAPDVSFASTLLTMGWVFGGLTAAAVLFAAVGLMTTAVRNRPFPGDEPNADVTQARQAWHEALLEHGILPFLREALATTPHMAAPHGTSASTPTNRMPTLGYDRRGNDPTSPDFAGPDHKPE